MSKEIYISTTPHETRLAIVEEEQLAEVYFERENEYTLAGSIYNGKVTRVLPGMQSSFVDIGLERDAFLYVTDFMEEAGDSADFESSEGIRKPQPLRETAEGAPRDGARGRRRGGRDRGNREQQPEATASDSGDTELFDAPIAPQPVEASAVAEDAGENVPEEQGSRRWRGRRGRRRGRGGREGGSPLAAENTTAAETAELDQNFEEEPERLSLEGSSEDIPNLTIEIDADAEPRTPEPVRSGRFGGEQARGRRGRDGRGRGREERPRREFDESSKERSVPSYTNVSEDESQATGDPIVLPGESIRKYRDPADVAAEDAARQATRGPVEVVAKSAPDLEIVGWDGGAVLPGETLSRRKGKDAPLHGDHSQAAGHRDGRYASQGKSEAVFEQRASTDQPAHSEAVSESELSKASGSLQPVSLQADASHAAVEHAPEEAQSSAIPQDAATAENISPDAGPQKPGDLIRPAAHAEVTTSAAAHAPLEALDEGAEYEPAEGDAASLGDTARRDVRRLERREREEDDQELLAPVPDSTTYDLNQPENSSEAFTALESPLDLTHGPVVEEASPEFTTLEPFGTMVSESATTFVDDAAHLPVSQDADETIVAETSMQAAVLSQQDTFDGSLGDRAAAEESAGVEDEEPLHDGTLVDGADAHFVTDGPVSQVHAYGDGDLEEEEVEGDEYEYDLAVAAGEEDEFEDYEEQTLDGSDAIDSVLEELSLDENGDEQEDDLDGQPESAAGGFTVEDFGGEPEAAEAAPFTQSNGERRDRREGRRGGSRDRDRRPGGGFRGGAGATASGDRGRGRGRQSVQTMDLPAINELLKPGQEILVQIAKEPIAKKGARITSHIALPGRFLVFMPTVNHTGVSRKISSDEERRRLKSILLSEKGDAQGGFIVRTAADGASEEELRNDLRFLIQLWQDIKARSESSKSPALIYHDLSLIERILRDQVTDNFSAIWVDTEAEYERVLRFLQRFQPSLVRRVKLYTKETPMFEHFGVTAEINKALKSKVWLKSGGSIVIDQTEALVAIDINTGKYVGKTARLEDTILKTNLDAIPEIVRQIRLRDLGGIIVIDFIDMDDRRNRARVMQVLEEELKSDRAPSKVLPFNDFGLVIMTRKRVKQSLERTLCVPDPITEGTGMIKSPITVANEIYTEMRKMQRQFEKSDVMLRVHPEVVKTLKANGGKRLQELEDMTRKTILVKSDPAINPEQFDIH